MNTDKKKALVGITLVASLCGLLPAAPEQEYNWDKAEKEIRRLKPSEFKSLPGAVVKELEEMRCAIPQSYVETEHHNVIHGEFARAGQVDWAVLCSKGGKSSVIVFWKEPTACPRELAAAEDRSFLQEIGEGRISFSRVIGPVGQKYIVDHYRWYGGSKWPPISHQGIDDAFAGKASQVHYCHDGKWLRLTGAD